MAYEIFLWSKNVNLFCIKQSENKILKVSVEYELEDAFSFVPCVLTVVFKDVTKFGGFSWEAASIFNLPRTLETLSEYWRVATFLNVS